MSHTCTLLDFLVLTIALSASVFRMSSCGSIIGSDKVMVDAQLEEFDYGIRHLHYVPLVLGLTLYLVVCREFRHIINL